MIERKLIFVYGVMLLLLSMTLSQGIALGASPPTEEIRIFVKIDSIGGDSVFKGYKDWIEAVAYSDSLQAIERECPALTPILIQKSFDTASPTIRRRMLTTNLFASVEVHALKGTYLIWKVLIENARISEITSALATGEIYEVLTFDTATNFPLKVTWTSYKYDVSGKMIGEVTTSYDTDECQ